MPVYNAYAFLQQAVDSVISQTYQNWELIIINDGSTDKTEDQIEKIKDYRIKYIYQENQGVSAARNSGMNIMTGDYFCFLDADDELTENSLEDRINVFKSFPDIDFVDGSVSVYDFRMGTKQIDWTPSIEGNVFYDLLQLTGKSFFGITWMIKRQPGFIYKFSQELTHGEDLYFFLTLAKQGLYKYSDSLIYKCRSRKNSAMTNINGLEDGYFTILQKLKNELKVGEEASQAFSKKIRSIMFKSWLAKGNLYRATKVWFK